MIIQRILAFAAKLCLLSVLGLETGLATEPLKVCAAANELPYSNRDKQGFENRIAELIAAHLDRALEYVWWKDARYYIRDFLDKGDCDLVIGLDTDDPRVLTTEPYYRSGYVFVTQEKLEPEITAWDDPRLLRIKKIAFVPNTPAEVMIRAIGRYNDQFNYLHSLVNFKSRRNQHVRYDPARLVDEVDSGNAEIAVLWAPAAARYVRSAHNRLSMTLIADDNVRADGEKVPHHYSTSFGVRKDDPALLAELNEGLKALQPKIEEILREEGIPLVSESSERLAAKN